MAYDEQQRLTVGEALTLPFSFSFSPQVTYPASDLPSAMDENEKWALLLRPEDANADVDKDYFDLSMFILYLFCHIVRHIQHQSTTN